MFERPTQIAYYISFPFENMDGQHSMITHYYSLISVNIAVLTHVGREKLILTQILMLTTFLHQRKHHIKQIATAYIATRFILTQSSP